MALLSDAEKQNAIVQLGAYTQFEDLTEIPWLRAGALKKWMGAVQTEFVFWLGGPTNRNILRDNATKIGLQAVSTMNNWWPTHAGEERSLTLFWGRVKNPCEPFAPVKRTPWGGGFCGKYNFHREQTSAGGCGFKIGGLPLDDRAFARFFTLMRLPLELAEADAKWLQAHNYRHLDTGKMAQYWVNGWKPEEYSFKRELEYHGITREEWTLKGNEWL